VISVGSVFDPIGNRAKPLGDGVVAYYALAGDIFVARAVLRLDPGCISEVRLIEGRARQATAPEPDTIQGGSGVLGQQISLRVAAKARAAAAAARNQMPPGTQFVARTFHEVASDAISPATGQSRDDQATLAITSSSGVCAAPSARGM